jgi:hypothetical protein
MKPTTSSIDARREVFAKAARKRFLTRSLRMEHLEERVVMDASLYGESYFGGLRFTAKGSDAKWVGPSQFSVPSTYTTDSPVEVSRINIGAPDGAKQTTYQPSGDSYRATTMIPNNGLVTVENGQKNETIHYWDGTQRTTRITFAQQQEIELQQDFFPANVVPNAGEHSSTEFKTNFTVPTTGQYNFYITHFGGGDLRIGSASATWSSRTDPTKLTVQLTAGASSAFTLNYNHSGYSDSDHFLKVEYEGPGVPRQSFVPNNDITFRHNYGFGRSEPPTSGIISPAAYFSADKRLRDDNYALRYKTTFIVPSTGEYTFYLGSDDRAELRIGNDIVINKREVADSNGKRTLTAGTTVSLELNYLHARGERSLKLEWSGPGLSRQLFKTQALVTYDYFEGNFGFVDDFRNATPKLSGSAFDDPKSFVLEWNGQRTVPIQVGASAEVVKNALMGLSNVGAVGGIVNVSRATNGLKYNVTFSGSIWFRPDLMNILGRHGAKVNPVTKFAITKRDSDSTLTIGNLSRTFTLNLPNPNTFPIDNAPMFTPERLIYDRLVPGDFESSNLGLAMSGYLQSPAVGGRFDPEYIDSPNFGFFYRAKYNVIRTDSGLRVTNQANGNNPITYRLNAIIDSAGNSRPLTLFQMGGLSFDTTPGSKADLVFYNAQNEIEFQSSESSLLVSAPFEGGKLNLRLLRDGSTPIYRINLRTGSVQITPRFEFVSFEIGGFVIPQSEAFKMSYDAAAQKFSFAINNLVTESPHPDGTPKANEFNQDFVTAVQTFDVKFRVTNPSYQYVMGNWVFHSAESFRNNILTQPNLAKSGALYSSSFLSIPREAYKGYIDYFGAVYKWNLTVNKSGTYNFKSTGYGMQQLRINNAVALDGTQGLAQGAFQLTAGVEYQFEYTQINTGSLRTFGFDLLFSGPSTDGFQPINTDIVGYITGIANERETAFLSYPTPENVKASFDRAIDYQENLTGAQRKVIKESAKITVEASRITITNIPYLIKITGQWSSSYQQRFSNPVKLTIPRGTISVTRGKLDPITDLPIDSFEIGSTTIDESLKYVTTFEPIKPTQAGGFKAAFFQRNTYNTDGSVNIPGNTFGVYGNQSRLPLDLAGVKLDGTANLGTANAPGLVVTNGQFIKLTYPVPDVTVDGLVFSATSVGSAKPLSVNYYPPVGAARKSYVVQGGAVMKPGGTVVKSDLKTNFGGMGSDGLRIFAAKDGQPASFTLSFGVADTFLAGTQAIQSIEGANGLKLRYDPLKKEYKFEGDAYLDFNPKSPHTATNLAFTGTKLEVSASLPVGVTGFSPNRLNGSTLNFFLGERASINGFQIAPRATANPLRIAITDNNDTIGGSFTMRLANSYLFGVMETTSFNGAKAPAGGYLLDFTPIAGQPSGFSLAGVLFTNSRKTQLTDTLVLKFEKATFQGNDLAIGAAGSEPAVIEAKNGKITKGEIVRATPIQLGDIAFNNLKATYIATTASTYWSFKGPGRYFDKSVQVGAPGTGNPQMKIGGDPAKGYQLDTQNEPAPLITPDFKLPETIEVAGLNLDTSILAQDEPVIDEGPNGKTFSLKSADYKIKLGNTQLTLNLKVRVKVSPAGIDIVSFSATGVQNTQFTLGNAKFQVQTLTVEYNLAKKQLNISGKARFTFTAGKGSVDMTVTMGTPKDPGLVISDGSVQSLKVTVDGSFELLKLSIAAESLTLVYQKESNEFAIFGSVKISTAAQGGIQVIKDLAVTLGSEEKPGIKIADGSLRALDITINGEINLFKMTATPKDLHIAYSAEDNQLQIDGELSVTLAPKLTVTAGLPGDGLLIDTETGKVQVRGLSLTAESDITFGAMVIKGLHIDYEEAENGEVSIGAAAEIQLPSGLAVGGSFKIINGKLDAIGIKFEKNPGILVANGLVNIYGLDVSVEGLSDLDNFKFKGTVKATVGPLVKFAGQSYALADVTGTIEITTRYLKLTGDVQLVGGLMGHGFFDGTLLWNPPANNPNQLPRVTFDAEVKLFPGDVVRGTIKAYADIRGNVDFNANMGVFVPNGIPLAGGASLGQLYVELQVRPALEPSASYVKFGFSDIAITAVRIPTFHGNVRVGFDAKVDYGFGARFFIPLPWPLPDIDFSLDFNGSFQLRDSHRPFIEILAAAALDGTPNGEILFTAQTPLPAGTRIDLYADRDNLGNDGFLIASGLQYNEGTQRFVWEDLAAFAGPGQPVYVYAVINDQVHAPEYSSYSPQFNVASGFVPSIVNPTRVNFTAGEPMTFSEATGNAIVIVDPRASTKLDSEVEVSLSVGAGTVDLSHAPDHVQYRGAGTGKLTLQGTAANITAALDGLKYIQRVASSNTDTLNVSVHNLPLLNQAGNVVASIVLDPKAVSLSMIASADSDVPTTITQGSQEETPLAYLQIDSLQSGHLIGAKIAIQGYEAGKDVLMLPLSDEIASGIESAFDADTGVLTLSAFDWTEDFQYALQQVVFSTSSMASGKSLKVSLADDNGDTGEILVSLTVVAGHIAPKLELSKLGTSYTPNSGSVRLDAESNLVVAEGSSLQRITVAFVEDSYLPNEDRLTFSGSSIQGDFDVELGSLVLTGTGTDSEWLTALQSIRYESIGENFTEGSRFLKITIEDDAQENNSASSLFVIRKAQTHGQMAQPQLTLNTTSTLLPANEDFVYIADGLTLVSEETLLLGAVVTISQNYIRGEDELQVTSLWDGMDAEFDVETGMLTITGVASAYEYEDVLRSILFVDAAGYRTPGDIEITFNVFDGLTSNVIDTLNLTIESAPYLVGAIDNVLTYEQGRDLEMIGADIDVAFESAIVGATVRIQDGFYADQDELSFVEQNGITGTYDKATGILTLSGNATAAQYEAALAQVGYRNSRFNPVAGDRVVAFQIHGQTATSNEVLVLISVEPQIVPPQVIVGLNQAYQEDGAPISIAPDLNIAALDETILFLSAPEKLYGAEIVITNYVAGEDLLGFFATDNVTGEFDTDEGRLVLYGEATFEEYEAVIRSITYRNASEVPTTTTREFKIRLLDSGANGMESQWITTQVVIGSPDSVSQTAGVAEDIRALQNSDFVLLGLEDLQFDSPAINLQSAGLVELRFTATQLPSSAFGRILLSDGSELEQNIQYSLSQLAGLRFEPAPGAVGTEEFTYRVSVADADSGNIETSGFADTLAITLEGIGTSTPSQAYVAQAYRDLLGKNPDPVTLASLANSLDDKLKRVGRSQGFENESQARQRLLVEIVSNQTYQIQQINHWYQKLLLRPATSNEVATLLLSLQGGLTLDEIPEQLVASNEFFELHNGEGHSSYLEAVYEALLDRPPTDAELTMLIVQMQLGLSKTEATNSIGGWSNWTPADQQALIQKYLSREYQPTDSLDFDFSSRQSLWLSIVGSQEYYDAVGGPSTSGVIPTHETSEYSYVGILGDIVGGKAGGTLIAPQYVLVAAHSVVGIPKGQLTFEIGGYTHRIAEVIVHPDFDTELLGGEGGNDIAILKLDMESEITPAQLTGRAPRLNEVLQLVGFGEHEGDRFGTKRVGSTPALDEVGATVFRWTQTSPDQNDSDAGDSGSPLIAQTNGDDLVIGIVMGGTTSFTGVGSVATNTRIDAYLAWIQSIVPSIQVSDANDPPSLFLDDMTLFLDENSGPHLVGFEVSAVEPVTFSVTSSHPTLFSQLRVDYDGTGLGDIVFETGTNERGTATIVVIANAGALSASQTITVSVEERNDPPTMNAIKTQVVDIGGGAQTVPLSGLSAGTGETGNVMVSILDVVPNEFFSTIGIGPAPAGASTSDKSIQFTPSPTATGNAYVTLEIRDAGPDGEYLTEDDAFSFQQFTVVATANEEPTIAALSTKRVALAGGQFTIPLAGIGDGGDGSQPLRFDVTSSNLAIANMYVAYDPSQNASAGQLVVIPIETGATVVSVNITDPGDDGQFETEDDRTTSRSFNLDVVTSLNAWHNFSNPFDVNNDSVLDHLDVLLVINYLNRNSAGSLPPREIAESPFIDVNDDAVASPLDVLQIINRINQVFAGEGESVWELETSAVPLLGQSAVQREDELARKRQNDSLNIDLAIHDLCLEF